MKTEEQKKKEGTKDEGERGKSVDGGRKRGQGTEENEQLKINNISLAPSSLFSLTLLPEVLLRTALASRKPTSHHLGAG
ncbi:hypothetical protein BaRGS_00030564 [Batillaria attramentaria]|uniref:Uncharacterized protein n=1 Tax=Batillaria attramentaria TaxID=370345 RepID=A0ABD0JTJ1_9CAEN